jgi:uncharacterized protein
MLPSITRHILLAMKSRRAKLILAVGFAVVVFLGLWSFWWEPSSLTVVRHSIALNPWYAEHAGLKIAVISDLHVGSPYRTIAQLKEVVAAVNAEKPDLVLLLGDFVIGGVIGGRFVQPEPIAGELALLQAPLGVVSVLGNHDWDFDGARVRRALESARITVLDDENLRVTYRGRSFWLSGLGDLYNRGNHAATTLAKIEGSEPILVLMHNPDIFPDIPQRVTLSLAGHTHGGQVNFPIVGRLVVPSRFRQRFAYGLVEEAGRKLFVTGGVGTSIIPVRFRVAPEIVMLTVTQK